MTGRRGMAVAIALLLAALAAAGCGLGPGADVGSVELTVTREYGAVPVLQRSLEAKESDTVMRALEGSADIETRYGGGFVHSINGVAEGERGGDPYDWFFYVDGVESPVGAADVSLQGGERIWWDYRDWSATNHVPAVVGSWPAPFTDGIAGKPHPVVVECAGEAGNTGVSQGANASRGSFRSPSDRKAPRAGWRDACHGVQEALEREGVKLASGGSPKGAIRVLVGPWKLLRKDPAAGLVQEGPAESGVYADFEAGVRPFRHMPQEKTNAAWGWELGALDEGGGEARRLGPNAGLVAATSRYGGPPVWLVTGGTSAAVRAAAGALDAAHLRDHYAVAIEGGKTIPLPVEGR
ncbi:MAG TPA: DUF4430 domain-containing protein [Solirubrobacterales bacterium]|nr:DUF4430 domain-containing protein [Solirubrobacterales bacterium]